MLNSNLNTLKQS